MLREELEEPLRCRLFEMTGVLPVSLDLARTDSGLGTVPGTQSEGRGGAAFGLDRWHLGTGLVTSCLCQETDLLAIPCNGRGQARLGFAGAHRRLARERSFAVLRLKEPQRVLAEPCALGEGRMSPAAHSQMVPVPFRSQEPVRRARED